MGFISDAIDSVTGGSGGEKAAKRASKAVQAGIAEGTDQKMRWMDKGLDYLTANDENNQLIKGDARAHLAGVYGLEGGVGSQQDMIDQAQGSPLYDAIMGTRQAGEDAIMRNASATGGLRSGNVQRNLYNENQRLQESALLESYNQQMSGLEGLSNLSSNEQGVANAYAQMGQTRGQGTIDEATAKGQGFTAGAQAIQAGRGGLMEMAGPAVGAAAAAAFSDNRLKDNIQFEGTDPGTGLNMYSWDWNTLAGSLGLSGRDSGVMAHEVQEKFPEAVGESQGYQTVNYAMLEA